MGGVILKRAASGTQRRGPTSCEEPWAFSDPCLGLVTIVVEQFLVGAKVSCSEEAEAWFLVHNHLPREDVVPLTGVVDEPWADDQLGGWRDRDRP